MVVSGKLLKLVSSGLCSYLADENLLELVVSRFKQKTKEEWF